MAPSPEERLATIEARVEALVRDRGELRENIKEMRVEVREIRDTIVAARGGWKAYAALGGFLLFIGAMADRIVTWAAKAL
jgi:hypothetical protein